MSIIIVRNASISEIFHSDIGYSTYPLFLKMLLAADEPAVDGATGGRVVDAYRYGLAGVYGPR